MNSLDPSYLRYIYDGIFNGVIASDNESTLPEGLVGLYEDAFLENIPVNSRQKSLEIFACWALLKKEASILFVSEILLVDETEVFELVGTYSSWFNSPETGKYSLYHERLRIYFLQKLGENELQRLNHRLIARLQKAISDQNKDEFEIYALQFLSDHLIVEAFADETKGKELLDFTKNELIWNRQIKISNQFTWTKNTIQNTILWTSKYQPKESVFGYLDLVELHHKEQNDAENIVALVANNEIDLALKRIESFGGTDKEGLQRKFILYMLCFMELILLESKTQPWRKEALEKILKHFDEQLPIDHSILNWNDFFPSYLIFQIACELAEMGFNYLLLYKRTDDWDSDWISTKGPYFDFQFDVLFSCVLEISIDSKKNSVLIEISISLAKQGKIEKSDSTMLDVITYTRDISDSSTKSIALMEISTAFAVIGNKLEAVDSYMQEAISCVNTLKFDYIKSITLSQISNELIKQGKLEKAISIVEDINDVEQKSLTFSEISIAFAKLGKKKESSYYFKGINFDYLKSITLCKISNELFKQGNIEEANLVIKEAISFAVKALL